MPVPHLRPPSGRRTATNDIDWARLRRSATVAFLWLQAGWTALEEREREEVRQLVGKSGGRPHRLTREETRRLGRLAGKAATGARRLGPRR
jgi:hypothetical protein